MCRGDHREPIVQDDVDRAEFVRCLGDACAKTEWQVHAYALLGNHYHIRWIGERLAMGYETRVSQSVRAVADAEYGELLTQTVNVPADPVSVER
jgi:hypothetical protein